MSIGTYYAISTKPWKGCHANIQTLEARPFLAGIKLLYITRTQAEWKFKLELNRWTIHFTLNSIDYIFQDNLK